MNIAKAQDQFNFNVTEIEIYNKGNLYKGIKRGTITTKDGIILEANTFTYNKLTNIVDAEGQVKIEDVVNNYIIFSDTAKYRKNDEIIIAQGNSKGIDDKNRTITSDKLTYNKLTNIVDAEGQVKIEDVVNNYIIFSDTAKYRKNDEIIIAQGNSKGIDDKNRTITSDKLTYNKLTNIVDAEGQVKIEDVVNNYIIFSDTAKYRKNDEIIIAQGNSKGIDDKNRTITSDKLTYNKLTNIVDAEGQVKIEDVVNNYIIFSDTAKYRKNDEIIIAQGNSKGIDDKNRTITSDKLTYNKLTNIVDAEGQVKIEDIAQDYVIETNTLTYFRSSEKITTKGFTKANIENKYKIVSENVTYLLDIKELSSKIKSTILDNNNQIYYLDEFIYYIETSLLKGKNILTITNYNLPKSDKFFFLDGIFNLNSKKFTASETKINIHNNIFDEEKNDPRIYGVSSKGENNITVIKKGIFTNCQKRDGCPPWSIRSEKIEHDKSKRQIEYINAFLNIYDVPVFYFPKFFHPDPTVNRQTGFLRPEINKSNVLGSSITQPYFGIISENKDYTFSPTWFDKDIMSLQSEYRQANNNSNFLADFGFVNGYQNNNRSHLFVKYDLDLNLDEYISSDLFVSIEQVSNDTYLSVFAPHITKSKARPNNLKLMENKISLNLEHEDYNFSSGFTSYEDLNISKGSDRYQYILPYYNFDTVFGQKLFNGSLSFSSSGSNNLNNTNDLKSNITNNLNYSSPSFLNKFGLKNEYNLYFKNTNRVGKKSTHKSSPQIELESLFEYNSSIPLIKKDTNYNNSLTPKISFKFNPIGMKDNSSKIRTVDIGNIFSTNRLGLGNSFEEGKSLTIGLDYRKEKVKKMIKKTTKRWMILISISILN